MQSGIDPASGMSTGGSIVAIVTTDGSPTALIVVAVAGGAGE